jgi:N-acetyl sugar amidotransferase
VFDNNGVCSYCRAYEIQEAIFVKKGADADHELKTLVDKIKIAGSGKQYDSIIGISGGVDSTYLAYQAKKLGLRPLAVHFDNGWNSELAVNNIEKIIGELGFDLETFVMDWEEFRDIQLSFLKSSVVDIELVTDHAIITKLYQLAIQHNIKYILSGSNVVTEAVLPSSWIHDKRDHIHIRAIHERFGTIPLKTFPLFTSPLKWMVAWKGIQSVSLLDLMPYNKAEVKRVLINELGWRDYGGKHYESVFTRFYQGHILPLKFGVDKRKAHLSNLICSGQITREEALIQLRQPAYDAGLLRSDYEFVLKKLGLSKSQFEAIMNAPVKKHSDYPTERSIYERFPVLKVIRPLWKNIKLLKKLE